MAYMLLEQTTGDTCGDGKVPLPFRWRVKESDFEKAFPDMEIVGLRFSTPIPISQEIIDNFPTEIRIERIGSCNQCGYCCGWIDNKAADHCCDHILRAGGSRGECGIYANLTDVCSNPDCGKSDPDGTHSKCLPPPNNPYHKDNPDCGYSWIVTTPGIVLTDKEVIRIYWATDKDLTGKWIR